MKIIGWIMFLCGVIPLVCLAIGGLSLVVYIDAVDGKLWLDCILMAIVLTWFALMYVGCWLKDGGRLK